MVAREGSNRRFYLLLPVAATLLIGVTLPADGAVQCIPRTLASLGPPPMVIATGQYPDGTSYADPDSPDLTGRVGSPSPTTSPSPATTAATTTTTTTAAPTTTTTVASSGDSGNWWDWRWPRRRRTTTTTTTSETTQPSVTQPSTTEPLVEDTTTTTPPPPKLVYCDTVWEMVYPVVGQSEITSTFGQERQDGWRWHAGADIRAAKWTPVVAVADGRVERMGATPDDCCWLAIEHAKGWETLYAHLTNDTPGTNDGAIAGIRPDLKIGTKVKAGEVIGWVGDSGNAEGAIPHLHFELRMPEREPVDPLPSLLKAKAHPAADTIPDTFDGPFVDDDHLGPTPYVEMLLAGYSIWCDEWGLAICHDHPATSSDVGMWIGFRLSGRDLPRWMPATGRTASCLGDSCSRPTNLGSALTMLMAASGNGVLGDPNRTHARFQETYEGCFPYSSPNDSLTRAQLDRLVNRVYTPVKSPICYSLS